MNYRHLSPAHLAVFQGNAPSSESLGNDIALGGTYIDELFSADIIIIGVPMYTFLFLVNLKRGLTVYLSRGGHSITPRMVRRDYFLQVKKCMSLQPAVVSTAVPVR
nr:Uncharacterised protein [Raoultella sp. NCTC 9187]